MNWHLIYIKLLPVIIGILAISISFYLPKDSLRRSRKNKFNKASIRERVLAYVCVLGITVCLSLFFGYLSSSTTDITYSFIWFMQCGIPALFSVMYFFDKEDRMTIEQKLERRDAINKENQENKKYPNPEY